MHRSRDEQILHMGDDICDPPVMDRAGVFYASSDALPFVLRRVRHPVASDGARGVVREVANHLLMGSGLSDVDIYAPLLEQRSVYHAIH